MTRDGNQMTLIEKMIGTEANCIYMQVIRSHGGDEDSIHNPFVDGDVTFVRAKSISEEAVLYLSKP